MKSLKLKTKGMECTSCEQRIVAVVKKLEGVTSVVSNYANETTTVEYDENQIDADKIKNSIIDLGYVVENLNTPHPLSDRFGTLAIALGIIGIMAGIYLVLSNVVGIDLNFTNISTETSLAALFLLGFLTGFHCIGMCGGFVLSYSKSLKKAGDFIPHLMYGSGKTISYTIIGALFGAVGSFIAFTTELRAGVAIVAGIFLVLYGINMLNIFPILRKLQLRLPSFIPVGERKKNHGPLVTGLLNGLMIACGPLQALYLFAAGTGSAFFGAQALFFFGLGTLVPLITFGIASNFLSAALSHNVVKFSGVLVVLMGIAMASNGMNLLGIGFLQADVATIQDAGQNITITEEGYQIIEMDVTRYGWEPNTFVLKKGVPVKWKINAKEINGCNNEIIVREYDLTIKLKQGESYEIEFTPDREGTIRWSCWMGMIQGQFIVTENVEIENGEVLGSSALIDDAPELPRGSSCGCGG